MSALEPGRFYKATVEGVPDVVIMITDDYDRGFTARQVPDVPNGTYGHAPEDITDAYPLIVLDLEDPADYAATLRQIGLHTEGIRLRNIANQIEAQTKPTRIEEPGLWGVVEASSTYLHERLPYIHTEKYGPWAWTTQGRGSVTWADIIDPTLIREGLS